MLHMVSDQQLARMHAHFIVPVVVSDILSRKRAVEDDEKMALHELLSDMQPDSALLAMALATQHMAFYSRNDVIFSNSLSFHADRIINDYGPFWLMHAENDSRLDEYEQELFEMLSEIPNDFGSLIDVLSVARDSIRDQNNPLAVIADIFCKQAEAQQLIAATFLEVMEEEDVRGEHLTSLDPMFDGVQTDGSNVLYFPGVTP